MEGDDVPKAGKANDPRADTDDDPDWCMEDEDLDERGDVEHSISAAKTSSSGEISMLSIGIAEDTPSRRTSLVNDGVEQTVERKITSKCNNITAGEAVGTEASIGASDEASMEGSKQVRHPGISKRVSFRCSPRLSRRSSSVLREKMGVKKNLTIKRNTRKDSLVVAENTCQKEMNMLNTDATGTPTKVTECSTKPDSRVESEGMEERLAPFNSDQPIPIVSRLQADARDKDAQLKHAEQRCLDVAIQKYKSCLTCVQCLKTGSLAKNGVTRFNGKVLKCNNCHKQTTGKAVLALLDQQIGRQWRTEQETTSIVETDRTNEESVKERQNELSDRSGDCENERVIEVAQGNKEELGPQGQGTPSENSGFIKIPAHMWENTLQSINALTSQTRQLLNSQRKLTNELEQANNRIRKLENEIAIGSRQSPACVPHETAIEKMDDPMSVDTPPAVDVTDAAHLLTQRAKPDKAPNIQQGPRKNGTSHGQLNWAEIAKQSLQRTTGLPGPLDQRIQKTIRLLDRNNCRVLKEPSPIAVYFKNVRRGPIGAIRSALRESLPSWALLGIGFVGGSVLEIVTDNRLKARLIATLKIMGIEELAKFDVLGGGIRRGTPGSAGSDRTATNLQATIRRLSAYVQENRCGYATKWYRSKLAEAKLRLQKHEEMKTSPLPQNNENHEKEGEKSDTEKKTQNGILPRNAANDGEGWTTVQRKRNTVVREEPQLVPNNSGKVNQDGSADSCDRRGDAGQHFEKEHEQSDEITAEKQ